MPANNKKPKGKQPSGGAKNDKKKRKDDEDDALLEAAIEETSKPKVSSTATKKKPAAADKKSAILLPTFDYTDAREIDFTCTICLAVYRDPQELYPCKHTFCKYCMDRWKRSSDTKQPVATAAGGVGNQSHCCPLCRDKFSSYGTASESVRDALLTLEGQCSDCEWVGTKGNFDEVHAHECKPADPEAKNVLTELLKRIDQMLTARDPAADIWKLIEENSIAAEDTMEYAKYLNKKLLVFRKCQMEYTTEVLEWGREAHRITEKRCGSDFNKIVSSLIHISNLELLFGNYREARGHAEKLLREYKAAGKAETVEAARALRMLGTISNFQRDCQDAYYFFQLCENILKTKCNLSNKSAEVIQLQCEYTLFFYDKNENESRTLSRQLLQNKEFMKSGISGDNMLLVCRVMAQNCEVDSRYQYGKRNAVDAQSKFLLNAFADSLKKRMGREHPDVISLREIMALIDFDSGSQDQARRELNNILRFKQKFYGANHPEVAKTLRKIHECAPVTDPMRQGMGRFFKSCSSREEASPFVQKADAIDLAYFGKPASHWWKSGGKLGHGCDTEEQLISFISLAERMDEHSFEAAMIDGISLTDVSEPLLDANVLVLRQACQFAMEKMVNAGHLPKLVEIMTHEEKYSQKSFVNAVRTIAQYADSLGSHKDHAELNERLSIIPNMVKLLQHNNEEIFQYAAQALSHFSAGHPESRCREIILNTEMIAVLSDELVKREFDDHSEFLSSLVESVQHMVCTSDGKAKQLEQFKDHLVPAMMTLLSRRSEASVRYHLLIALYDLTCGQRSDEFIAEVISKCGNQLWEILPKCLRDNDDNYAVTAEACKVVRNIANTNNGAFCAQILEKKMLKPIIEMVKQPGEQSEEIEGASYALAAILAADEVSADVCHEIFRAKLLNHVMDRCLKIKDSAAGPGNFNFTESREASIAILANMAHTKDKKVVTQLIKAGAFDALKKLLQSKEKRCLVNSLNLAMGICYIIENNEKGENCYVFEEVFDQDWFLDAVENLLEHKEKNVVNLARLIARIWRGSEFWKKEGAAEGSQDEEWETDEEEGEEEAEENAQTE